MQLDLADWGYNTLLGPSHAAGDGYIAVLDDASNVIARVRFQVIDNTTDPTQTRSRITLNDTHDLFTPRTGVQMMPSLNHPNAAPYAYSGFPELDIVGDSAPLSHRFALTISGDAATGNITASLANPALETESTNSPAQSGITTGTAYSSGAIVSRPTSVLFQCGSDGDARGGIGYQLWNEGNGQSFVFSASALPSITSFTPISGGMGKVVTITGTNLTGATAVNFGGTAAAFTVVSATSISATVGSGATGMITVTTPGGTATSASSFTYIPAPTITSFTPTNGAAGTVVTITGTNFTGATAVAFGGTAAASFTVVSAISITATVGSSATGAITVTAPGGTATSVLTFTFIPPPTITSFTPTSGGAGTTVTITGTNFTGTTTVTFGGTERVSFTVVSATSIIATVGTGASGAISVTTPGGTATSTGTFILIPAPAITSFTPTSGVSGTVVTITGTNFTGASAVALGGTAVTSFTVVSATSITATVGSGATGTITVTTPGGTAISTGTFTFIPAPTITSFAPTSGGTGTVVVITGTNFTWATAVTFGGTVAASFTIASATSIIAIVGSGTTGTITVTTTGGKATSTGTFTIIPAPTITSFTPTSGITRTMVTITGTNFTGATAVAFGGTAAESFTVISSTSLTATIGSGVTGTISVTTLGGTAVSTSVFTFIYTPPLTGLMLNTTPLSPVICGTQVSLLAAAIGGADVLYQYWIYNPAATPAWNQLQGYSSSAGCTWTPAAAGNYMFSVTAQDVTGAQVNTLLWFTVNDRTTLTAVSVTATPASPQLVNTPITLTAAAMGGKNIQYEFWVYNPAATSAWSKLQAYSSSAVCAWTPTIAGQCLLSVTAVDAGGTAVNTMCWDTVCAPLSAVSVTASPAAPQLMNTPVTLTAAATGGVNVAYQFWVFNPVATTMWSQLRGYSTTAVCTWTPTAPGQYLLSITALDTTGAWANTLLWDDINSCTPLTAVSVTAAPISPQLVNTPITFTACATGGLNVQYQFWLYNPAAIPAWSQLQAYSAQATCQWTPMIAGNYTLSATARDASGTAVNMLLGYTVTGTAPLSAVSVTASPASPQSALTPITFTAAATGGTQVQYQFRLYHPTSTSWSILQGFSSKTACTWTPPAAGQYVISITAQDASGTTVNTTFCDTVQ